VSVHRLLDGAAAAAAATCGTRVLSLASARRSGARGRGSRRVIVFLMVPTQPSTLGMLGELVLELLAIAQSLGPSERVREPIAQMARAIGTVDVSAIGALAHGAAAFTPLTLQL